MPYEQLLVAVVPLTVWLVLSVAENADPSPERTLNSCGNIALMTGLMVGSEPLEMVVGVAVAVSVDVRHGPVPVITASADDPVSSSGESQCVPHPSQSSVTAASAISH